MIQSGLLGDVGIRWEDCHICICRCYHSQMRTSEEPNQELRNQQFRVVRTRAKGTHRITNNASVRVQMLFGLMTGFCSFSCQLHSMSFIPPSENLFVEW
jgi:hypothetical protein